MSKPKCTECGKKTKKADRMDQTEAVYHVDCYYIAWDRQASYWRRYFGKQFGGDGRHVQRL